jgi:hypothetical protein
MSLDERAVARKDPGGPRQLLDLRDRRKAICGIYQVGVCVGGGSKVKAALGAGAGFTGVHVASTLSSTKHTRLQEPTGCWQHRQHIMFALDLFMLLHRVSIGTR